MTRTIIDPRIFDYRHSNITSLIFNDIEMKKTFGTLFKYIINITESIIDHSLEDPRTINNRKLFTNELRNALTGTTKPRNKFVDNNGITLYYYGRSSKDIMNLVLNFINTYNIAFEITLEKEGIQYQYIHTNIQILEQKEEEGYFTCDEYENIDDLELIDVPFQYDDILSNDTKFKILVKPCQSGKTQLVINDILTKIETNGNKSICFVDNSVLQNDQFMTRLNKDIEHLDSFSNRKHKINHTELCGFAMKLMMNRMNNITACSNYSQVDKITQLINILSESNYQGNIDVYIDEIDNNQTLLFDRNPLDENKRSYNKKFLDILEECPFINTVNFVTATPERVFKYFQEHSMKLELFYIKETHNDKYFRFQDASFICSKRNLKKFISFSRQMIEKIESPNCNLFIPSKRMKKSHNITRQILENHKFNVLVINSDGKKLYLQTGEIINVSESGKEIGNIIADVYDKYNLKDQRFAITGSICLARGITINTPRFMLTHAIYGDFLLNNRDNAVQTAMRICGNSKEFPNFVRTQVFCSKNFRSQIIKLENTIINYVPRNQDRKILHHEEYKNLFEQSDEQKEEELEKEDILEL